MEQGVHIFGERARRHICQDDAIRCYERVGQLQAWIVLVNEREEHEWAV